MDDYLRTLERAASEGLLDRTDRDSRGYDDTLVSRIEVRDMEGGLPDVVVGGRPARVTLELTAVVPQLECRLTILDNLGQPIATLNSEVVSPADTRDGGLGPRIECDIDSLPLLPGRYRLDYLLKGGGQIQDGLQAAAFFDVEPGVVDGRPTPASGADGNIVVPHRWRLPS